MNDFYFCTSLLAHGIYISTGGRILILSIMTLFVLGLLVCRKYVKVPRGLIVSSLISYVLMSIFIKDGELKGDILLFPVPIFEKNICVAPQRSFLRLRYPQDD
jgi:hypothetical protein